jgi:cobalt-zinc-cadmium efflux system membrane fusion protein
MTMTQEPREADQQAQEGRPSQETSLPARAGLSRQLSVSAAIIGLLAGGWVALSRSKSPAAAPEAAPPPGAAIAVPAAASRVLQIHTAPVRVESAAGVLRATGVVSFPADQTVKISPRLQGRVRQVLVNVGDRVAAGQTLAVLDSVDAAAAQANARQAENKLRLARANLERQERLYHLGTSDVTQAQANLDQARAHAQFTREVLQRTREQAQIGGFTQKPLEDARQAVVGANADLAQAQADEAQVQRERDRTARLVEIGVSARRDLEAAENALDKARVIVQADEEKLQLARQALDREQKAYRTNLYADQQVRSAESDYRQAGLQEEAADRALRLARAQVLRDLQQARSDEEAARADLESARRVLELYGQPGEGGTVRITSPIAGIVVERNVNSGQVVDQSQMTPWQMFTVSNAGVVWVDADVYEKDIARVATGEKVQVHVAAVPNRTFSGAVHYISPALDPKTHTVKVRTRIANPDSRLKDGMFVDMSIQTGRGPLSLFIPLSAVQHDEEGDMVYVAAGGRFLKRHLRLGKQRGEEYAVESGVKPGERVVTQGAIFLTGQGNSE